MAKTTSTHTPEDEDGDDAHLQALDDGLGCAEIWERLSEHRSEPNPGTD